MSESIRALIIIILVMILMGASGIYLMGLLYRRTVKNLFMIFRNAKAFSPETARFLDELPIARRSLLSFSVARDYTPQILQMLIKENIINITEEGRLFLSEEALTGHRLNSLYKKV